MTVLTGGSWWQGVRGERAGWAGFPGLTRLELGPGHGPGWAGHFFSFFVLVFILLYLLQKCFKSIQATFINFVKFTARF
jgi:hypothetical protein